MKDLLQDLSPHSFDFVYYRLCRAVEHVQFTREASKFQIRSAVPYGAVTHGVVAALRGCQGLWLGPCRDLPLAPALSEVAGDQKQFEPDSGRLVLTEFGVRQERISLSGAGRGTGPDS